LTPESLGRDHELREELVQVPSKARLDARPLGYQIIAVIHEQSQLASLAVEPGDGQVGFSDCSSRHREGVDRI
jgi:hypothetical protein